MCHRSSFLPPAYGFVNSGPSAAANSSTTSRPGNVVDRPFYADGNVATAGGCLSGQYLAAWIITRLAGAEAARTALHYIAPVGEKDEYINRAMGHVLAFTEPAVTHS